MQAVHYPKLLGRLGRIITHMALLDSGQFDSALGFQAAASEAASGAKEPATTAHIQPLMATSAPGAALFTSSPQSATSQKQATAPFEPPSLPPPAAPATAPFEPPATAASPPMPPPADSPPVGSHIELGTLVQVSSEHADCKFNHGAWGPVMGICADNELLFENKNLSSPGKKNQGSAS